MRRIPGCQIYQGESTVEFPVDESQQVLVRSLPDRYEFLRALRHSFGLLLEDAKTSALVRAIPQPAGKPAWRVFSSFMTVQSGSG
jgi:hypothetical protein